MTRFFLGFVIGFYACAYVALGRLPTLADLDKLLGAL